MAVCKDCIHFCVCSPYTAPNESYPEVDGCKCFRATADVVPKSEVVDLLDDLIKEAREIASRYEKSAKDINDCDYSKIEHEGRKNGALIVMFKISEFKKKYTE